MILDIPVEQVSVPALQVIIEMEVEEETSEIIMEAGAEEQWIDLHDQDPDYEQLLQEFSKEELNEFESLYRQGMRNHTTVEVCGKKKKTFFQAPKDRKMYKKHEGEFFHDRTIKKVSEGRSTKMIRAFNSGNSKKIEDVIR